MLEPKILFSSYKENLGYVFRALMMSHALLRLALELSRSPVKNLRTGLVTFMYFCIPYGLWRRCACDTRMCVE